MAKNARIWIPKVCVIINLLVSFAFLQCAEKKNDSTLLGLLLVGATNSSPSQKRMFLTATKYQGNLGGVSGADAKCNTDSRKPLISGTFKAYLFDGVTRNVTSTTTTHILTDYPFAPNTRYGRTDGTFIRSTIATSPSFYDDTFSLFFFLGNVGNASLSSTFEEFWVGLRTVSSTMYEAEVRDFCSNWTSNIGADDGAVGSSNPAFTGTLTFYTDSTVTCDQSLSLLCIEQ